MARVLAIQQNDNIEEINIKNRLSYDKAVENFKKFRESNVITNESIEDNKWILNNEVCTYCCYFNVNEFDYVKIKEIIHIEKDEFIKYMKSFVLLKMLGTYALDTISRFSECLRNRLLKEKGISSDLLFIINDFVNMLPVEVEEKRRFYQYTNSLRVQKKSGYRKIDFSSHLRFIKYLEKFWQTANKDEKIKYYPLYLYWKITTIIPRRVTAFSITKKECIRRAQDGTPKLVLYESVLKKNKGVCYNIDNDYEEQEYTIPEHLFEEILEYQRLVKSDDKYLFKDNIFGSSKKLGELLKSFYDEILNKKFGLKIIENKYNMTLENDCIGMVNLADTRHIAVMGIFLGTNDIVLASECAGHKNVNDTMNYVQNIAEYTKSLIHECYLEETMDFKEPVITKNKIILSPETAFELSDGTFCISDKIKNENSINRYDDCLESLGECSGCRFHRIKVNDRRHKLTLEENIESDMRFYVERIKTLINIIRKEKGHELELDQEILGLKTCAVQYKDLLIEENGGRKNG